MCVARPSSRRRWLGYTHGFRSSRVAHRFAHLFEHRCSGRRLGNTRHGLFGQRRNPTARRASNSRLLRDARPPARACSVGEPPIAVEHHQENLTTAGCVQERWRVNVLNQPYGGFPWLDLPPTPTPLVHRTTSTLIGPSTPRPRDVREFFKTYNAEQRRAVVRAISIPRRRCNGCGSTRRHRLDSAPAAADSPSRARTREAGTRGSAGDASALSIGTTPGAPQPAFMRGADRPILLQGGQADARGAGPQGGFNRQVSGGTTSGSATVRHTGDRHVDDSLLHDTDNPPTDITAIDARSPARTAYHREDLGLALVNLLSPCRGASRRGFGPFPLLPLRLSTGPGGSSSRDDFRKVTPVDLHRTSSCARPTAPSSHQPISGAAAAAVRSARWLRPECASLRGGVDGLTAIGRSAQSGRAACPRAGPAPFPRRRQAGAPRRLPRPRQSASRAERLEVALVPWATCRRSRSLSTCAAATHSSPRPGWLAT